MVSASATFLSRELADVLGGDDVDDGVGAALGSTDCCSEARMPVTTTSSTALLSCAKAGRDHATARRWRTRPERTCGNSS
jgi:hypothetical protein